MRNTAGVRHYFIEAFTPYGCISLLPELLTGKKNTYLLTGWPGTGKSTMIKLIGIQLIERGYEVDYIRSVREPDSVAGLFLTGQKIILLDQREFCMENINLEKDCLRLIDFTSFCKETKLLQNESLIEKLEKELESLEQELTEQLGKDYEVGNDRSDSCGIEPFLSVKSFLETGRPQQESLGEESPQVEEITAILTKIKRSRISFCFLHGIQIDGWLNLAPRYLKDFDRICLDVEDSSDVMRSILKEIRCLGQVIEIVVHPLKPYAIMGIVLPEKKLAVWKGNPSRPEEQGLAAKHSPSTVKILEEYRNKRIELKSILKDTVNFRALDELRVELLSSILTDVRR